MYLVTIGITCFNARGTILRALQSAIAQDSQATEIIVVDDHSTDGSTEVIRTFQILEPRVRLIEHQQNLGVGAARNTILAHARGEFVAFFDDDDESLPNRVNEQARVLSECEATSGARLIACYAGGERRYPNGYKVDAPAIGEHGPTPNGLGVALSLLVFKRTPNWFYGSGAPACALLARRQTFEAIGGFDPSLRRLEDVDLAIRLALKGGYFVGTAERLYIRHMTEGIEKSPDADLAALTALAEKHRPFLESIDYYQYALRWPRLRYWHFKRRYGRFAMELLSLLRCHPMAVMRHLIATGPARLIHEHRMRRPP